MLPALLALGVLAMSAVKTSEGGGRKAFGIVKLEQE